MPDYEALPPPPVPASATPPTPLTDTQEEGYNAVFAHFTADEYALPGLEEGGALTEQEKFWLSHECLLRFLRASKWVTATAIKRLEDTLKWRREFGMYDTITAEHVEPEALTGKEIIFGYDVDRRPGFYMFPSRQNTQESIRQVHYAVWMLERCIDLMGPGVETLVLLINYGDKGKSPSFSQSKLVLNIIQSHYPERLGRALILNVPFLLNTFYKIISPLIDPLTRTKMRFNPNAVVDGLFTPDMIMKDQWGGAREFVWDHDKYWPNFVQLCNTRREQWLSRWRTLGGKIGIREWDYKGGDVVAGGEIATGGEPVTHVDAVLRGREGVAGEKVVEVDGAAAGGEHAKGTATGVPADEKNVTTSTEGGVEVAA